MTFAGVRSEPEPDIVVNSSADLRELRSEKSRPFLVIEVSDSSFRFDRDQKAQLYAKGSGREFSLATLNRPTHERRSPRELAVCPWELPTESVEKRAHPRALVGRCAFEAQRAVFEPRAKLL